MGNIRIVTDSAADLLPEVAEKHGITVVPLTIRFGDDEFIDGVELSNDAFWQKMAIAQKLPSTAAPSPGAFAEAFRQAAGDSCDAVICISLSSKLSATYQNAVAGARLAEDAIPIHVVDSQACALTQGALVLEAAQAPDSQSSEEVVNAVQELRKRMSLIAALDTLDNLRKGGRIGAAGAFFGSILSVKPIVALRDGEVQAESRQRTRTRALEYLVDRVKEHAPVDHVGVGHTNAPDLDRFLDMLNPVVSRDTIEISHVGPVVATHTGPGLIAVSFASP
jgi:DegV family protein with EDD domain